jgi:hypothetical protein
VIEENEGKNEWSIFCVIDTSIFFNHRNQVEILSKALVRKEFDGKKGVHGKIVIPKVVEREVNDYYYCFDSKLTAEEKEAKKKYSELIQRQKERQKEKEEKERQKEKEEKERQKEREKEREKERKKILFRIKLKLFKRWAAEQNLEDNPEDNFEDNFEDKKIKAEIMKLEPEVKEIKDFFEKVKKAKVLIDKELRDNYAWTLERETKDIIHVARILQGEAGLYQNKRGEKVENLPSDSDLIILATAMKLSANGTAFVVTCDSGLANATIYVNRELGYWRVITKWDALEPWLKRRK